MILVVLGAMPLADTRVGPWRLRLGARRCGAQAKDTGLKMQYVP